MNKTFPDRLGRDDVEFGSERIVVGMRAAIRHLHTSCLSRKDIAEFAGVTPPLVTYYFPDRDALIEAATLPVVTTFAEKMSRCLSQSAPSERVLWDAIELTVSVRVRDGAVIDAYEKYREKSEVRKSNPLLVIDSALRSFFENWLKGSRNGPYYALLSHAAMIALCKSDPRIYGTNERYQCQLIYQILLCIIGDSEVSRSRIAAADRVGLHVVAPEHSFCKEHAISVFPER